MRTMTMMTVPSPSPSQAATARPLLLLLHHQKRYWQQLPLLLVLVILQLSCICYSMPTYLLEIPSQKCIEVEGPVDSTIRIAYFIPDLNVDKDDIERYTGPVQFTLNTIPSNRIIDTKRHMAPVLSRLKPITQSITTRTGQIEHTFEVDGTANICLSTIGTNQNPHHHENQSKDKPKISHLRLSIHVERKDIADLLLQLENNITSVIDNLDSKATVKHLSKMEMELQRIQLSMKTILKEADFAKERDAQAHHQVISIHSASMFWPIVQSCVLIMTGFTQASHIVHFFKTRRII